MTTPERIITNQHNNPPSPIEELVDTINRESPGFLPRATELTNRAKLLVVPTDDAQAGEITALGKDLALLSKDMDNLRKQKVQPYLDGQRMVNGFFNPIIEGLNKSTQDLRNLLTKYLQAKQATEQARMLAEAAEQRRIADEQAAAAAKLAPTNEVAAEAVLEQAIQTDAQAAKIEVAADKGGAGVAAAYGGGAMSSLAKKWVGRIDDRTQIDASVLLPYLTLDALQTALNKAVAAGVRKCPGTTIEEVSSARIR